MFSTILSNPTSQGHPEACDFSSNLRGEMYSAVDQSEDLKQAVVNDSFLASRLIDTGTPIGIAFLVGLHVGVRSNLIPPQFSVSSSKTLPWFRTKNPSGKDAKDGLPEIRTRLD